MRGKVVGYEVGEEAAGSRGTDHEAVERTLASVLNEMEITRGF